jgi:hypothetical protein
MTLKRYYSSFASLSGIFAGIATAWPFVSEIVPGNAFTFPPLGDVEPAARAGLVLLAFATTFGCYFYARDVTRNIGKAITTTILLSLLGLLIYLGLFERFVRKVEIRAPETSLYVTVGYERTAFALATFDSEPDEELLRARGVDDEQIHILWTLKSIIVVRLGLYVAYCTVIIALVAAFSFGVASDIMPQKLKLPNAKRISSDG